jgi:hypothetical protein
VNWERRESLVERQIREAAERGAFDDLPGAGRPLEGLDEPFSAERWARDWIRREGGDTSALLSPLLILRRERAALLDSLADVPTEAAVRELVSDFNRRLLSEYRRPMNGPLIPVGVLDPDETVAAWREQRPPPPQPVRPVSHEPRRQWWQITSRGRRIR